MSAPRVACIGAGQWGRNLVRNFAELGALAAVWDSDPAGLAALAERYPDARFDASFDQLIADPAIDAVAIATPAELHGTMTRAALEAGKDVFVEKPLCLSLDDGRDLVELAESEGRVLMVGHLLWYHPAVRQLARLVGDGELGQIRYIYSNRVNLGRFRREENILWSFAPHDVSVILGLMGEAPEEVFAHGGNYLHHQTADVTVSMLSFASGVKAHIFVSWLHPFKEQRLVVVGDRKMAVFDDLEPEHKLVLYPHKIDWQNRVPVPVKAEGEPVTVEMEEPLRAECAHFLSCISERSTPRTDGAEALRVLTVLKACQESLDGGGWVRPGGGGPVEPGERPYFLHESSYVDEDVEIGEGSRIWHFSHVLRGSRIGRDARIGQNVVIGPRVEIGDNVKIQNNVSVYEGVTLEDHVFCGPSMVFTNVHNPRSEIPRMDELRRTRVGRGASLGANCTVLCGTTIGRYAFVGAGAVVLRDVPDHALVVGNPGRVIGWMCSCGERIEFDGEAGRCVVCERRYARDGEVVKAEI